MGKRISTNHWMLDDQNAMCPAYMASHQILQDALLALAYLTPRASGGINSGARVLLSPRQFDQ